jgi:diguanylate cyclase (GGDEF)-like protein/excisionase family DNA binding protein
MSEVIVLNGCGELERRAAQQSAIAALGRRALTDRDAEQLVREAAETVHELLQADSTAIVQALPESGDFVTRAGTGPLGRYRTQAQAYALQPEFGAGVVTAEEDELPSAWQQEGLRSAALAAIGPAEDFGYLVAAWHEPRAFEADELTFLEAVAHVVAGALERSRAENEARRQALHDPLTGLPNRTLFGDRVTHAVARAARSESDVAVLFLDLDRFKNVNDTLGHHAGDELLVGVAQRLASAVCADDTLARFGGDEFAVLCEGLAGERGAIAVAQRLLEALAAPIVVEGHGLVASASIGITLADDREGTAEALIRDADVAMYRAKEHGGARFELFDRGMRRRVLERLGLERDLRTALDQEQFELFYQPIVSLEEPRILGLEALVRWNHPVQGLVSPAAFLPVAEESGLIVPLGRWVLREACRQAARWIEDPGLGDAYISVNLSGRQLADVALPEELEAILRRTGLPAERLALEVTEGVLMEGTTSPTAVLQRLKELGVCLVLDDFGTGYSSLNHVKRFPIEALKVDRSFIEGVAEEESDRHILAAIVSMATALDVEVIAEGVEAPEQAQWLRHLGIAVAQGYGLVRPAPAAAITPLLRDGLPLDRLAAAFAPLPPGALPAAGGRAARSAAATADDLEPTVTLGEAIEVLGVSASTLRRWADAGRLRTVRTRGGHRRFPVADVRRLSAAAASGEPPALRCPALPAEPIPALEQLLADAAGSVLATAAAGLYERRRPGWFAGDSAREQLGTWSDGVRAGARRGNYATALEATRRLLSHADYAGATLLERHTFLERFGDAVLRAMHERGASHGELVDARRLTLHLRRLALSAASGTAVA